MTQHHFDSPYSIRQKIWGRLWNDSNRERSIVHPLCPIIMHGPFIYFCCHPNTGVATAQLTSKPENLATESWSSSEADAVEQFDPYCGREADDDRRELINAASGVFAIGVTSFSLENVVRDSVGHSDGGGVHGAVEFEDSDWECEVLPLHERLRMRRLEVSIPPPSPIEASCSLQLVRVVYMQGELRCCLLESLGKSKSLYKSTLSFPVLS
jgi:hypothetical protein